MGIIFDAVFLLLIAVLVMTGVHRGVARSLLGLAGVLLAGFLAGSLSQPVAGWVYDVSLKNVMLDGLTQAIGSNTGADTAEAVFSSLPGWLAGLLQSNGLDQQNLEILLAQSGSQTAQAAEAVLRPVVVQLLRVVIAFIMFLVFSILLGVVTHALGKVFRLPLLRQIDGLLGGVVGLLQGIVCCVLLCLLLQWMVGSNPDPSGQWIHDGVSQSFVCQTVSQFLPVVD